jgi:hypothetical protein
VVDWEDPKIKEEVVMCVRRRRGGAYCIIMSTYVYVISNLCVNIYTDIPGSSMHDTTSSEE